MRRIVEDEKMIDFHVFDTMNRMIKSIEDNCSSNTSHIIRTKSSWETAKDLIASQSPFSSTSKSPKQIKKKKKKKKKSKWKFVRKLFGLKKSKKKRSPRQRSNSNDVLSISQEEAEEDLRNVSKKHKTDENEESTAKRSDEDDTEQVIEDDEEDDENDEDESESTRNSNQDVSSSEKTKEIEMFQDSFVFENSENVDEHCIGTILLLGILLFDENESDIRSIRIPRALYDALGSVYFGPGSKVPMGRTPSWISRRALKTMQNQLSGRRGGRLRRFSSAQHNVGSYFSAMTLIFLLRMSKFYSSLREILLDNENFQK